MSKQEVIRPSVQAFMLSPNWYLREQTPVASVRSARTRKYFELQEVTREDGFKGEVLVEKDYPITPEYVSSFAASADYHTDPTAAVMNAPSRRNLGDITALQSALGLDYDTARHLYREFRVAAEQAVMKGFGTKSADKGAADKGGEQK